MKNLSLVKGPGNSYFTIVQKGDLRVVNIFAFNLNGESFDWFYAGKDESDLSIRIRARTRYLKMIIKN